jgi:hypothetical protein
MKKALLFILLATLFIACNKIPYDQYYVWKNTTNTKLLLYVNPPENPEHPYFPVTASDNIWPPMVTAIINPHDSFMLHGTMTCDYSDEWYSVWVYPVYEGDFPYVTGPIKFDNKIE